MEQLEFCSLHDWDVLAQRNYPFSRTIPMNFAKRHSFQEEWGIIFHRSNKWNSIWLHYRWAVTDINKVEWAVFELESDGRKLICAILRAYQRVHCMFLLCPTQWRPYGDKFSNPSHLATTKLRERCVPNTTQYVPNTQRLLVLFLYSCLAVERRTLVSMGLTHSMTVIETQHPPLNFSYKYHQHKRRVGKHGTLNTNTAIAIDTKFPTIADMNSFLANRLSAPEFGHLRPNLPAVPARKNSKMHNPVAVYPVLEGRSYSYIAPKPKYTRPSTTVTDRHVASRPVSNGK